MNDQIKSVWQKIPLLRNSRLFSVLALVAIVAAIPLTVFIAQRQQETRQRAAAPAGASLHFFDSSGPLDNNPSTTSSSTISLQVFYPPPVGAVSTQQSGAVTMKDSPRFKIQFPISDIKATRRTVQKQPVSRLKSSSTVNASSFTCQTCWALYENCLADNDPQTCDQQWSDDGCDQWNNTSSYNDCPVVGPTTPPQPTTPPSCPANATRGSDGICHCNTDFTQIGNTCVPTTGGVCNPNDANGDEEYDLFVPPCLACDRERWSCRYNRNISASFQYDPGTSPNCNASVRPDLCGGTQPTATSTPPVTCQRDYPSISVSPSQIGNLHAGDNVNFTVSATNHSNIGCPQDTFAYALVESGSGSELFTDTVILQSGQTEPLPITGFLIQPSVTAGNYHFIFRIHSQSEPLYASEAELDLTVVGNTCDLATETSCWINQGNACTDAAAADSACSAYWGAGSTCKHALPLNAAGHYDGCTQVAHPTRISIVEGNTPYDQGQIDGYGGVSQVYPWTFTHAGLNTFKVYFGDNQSIWSDQFVTGSINYQPTTTLTPTPIGGVTPTTGACAGLGFDCNSGSLCCSNLTCTFSVAAGHNVCQNPIGTPVPTLTPTPGGGGGALTACTVATPTGGSVPAGAPTTFNFTTTPTSATTPGNASAYTWHASIGAAVLTGTKSTDGKHFTVTPPANTPLFGQLVVELSINKSTTGGSSIVTCTPAFVGITSGGTPVPTVPGGGTPVPTIPGTTGTTSPTAIPTGTTTGTPTPTGTISFSFGTPGLPVQFQGIGTGAVTSPGRQPKQVKVLFVTHSAASPTDANAGITGTATPQIVSNAYTGVYSITATFTLNPGSYDIYIKGPSHLRKKIGTATATATATGGSISFAVTNIADSLLAGDVVASNTTINIQDVSVIKGQFGHAITTSNRIDDLNDDGLINIQDVSLVKGNFGKIGD